MLWQRQIQRYTSSWEGPMRRLFRVFASFLVALCVTLPAFALDAPLSDEAVREAYFLGQRHDASFLGNYIKFCKTFVFIFIQIDGGWGVRMTSVDLALRPHSAQCLPR